MSVSNELHHPPIHTMLQQHYATTADTNNTNTIPMSTDCYLGTGVSDPRYYSSSDQGSGSSVRVNLGIDENLRMTLEMDPSYADFGYVPDTNRDLAGSGDSAGVSSENMYGKVLGLPPKSGGYVCYLPLPLLLCVMLVARIH